MNTLSYDVMYAAAIKEHTFTLWRLTHQRSILKDNIRGENRMSDRFLVYSLIRSIVLNNSFLHLLIIQRGRLGFYPMLLLSRLLIAIIRT